MIPVHLSDKLERILQRQALKIIYGYNCNLETVIAAKGIQTLHERREKAVLSFALKNERREKYGGRWFEEHKDAERTVRETTRHKYIVPFCRTERMKTNPIVHMTRVLNEHHGN